MMIGHLTVAGLAEGVVSAGVVAFVQRTDRRLLRLNPAPSASLNGVASPRARLRPLWLALGLS